MKPSSDISLCQFKRVNIIGSSGSGKSTFSKRLSSVLKIPCIEMDAVFWGPDWSYPSDEEFFRKIENLLDQECWILDGNYTRTTPIKWKRVQTVIWIDYSFPRTIFQSVKRATKRAFTKNEIWPGTGNRETFRKSFFSKESIILWSLKNYGKIKTRYRKTFSDSHYSHIQFIRISSPSDADELLRKLT